ncbi:MAG: hypothetical protein WD294_04455 [Phycisphaeraceae bacterium]
MSRSMFIGAALAIVSLITLAPAAAWAQPRDAASPPGRAQQPLPDPPEAARSDSELEEALALWEDLIHYYRVAQHDLAVGAGNALMALDLNHSDLLRVVEELSPYEDYDRTLRQATELAGEPGQVAAQMLELVGGARLGLARQGDRIRGAIDRLDRGLRHRLSAQQQLRRAGEYSAPQLLEIITGDGSRDRELAPYVIDAMVEVGRPIVAPLAEALPALAPAPRRSVAEVLGRIGYPMALPYLKAEIDREDADADTRRVMQRAFDSIVEETSTPRRATAADLFLRLAEDFYAQRGSLILQPNESYNLMWVYAPDTGLVFKQIPTPVFHDAMAMRTARRALQLNPNISAALSLWVSANFRRENNLPDGEDDPSYGNEMRSPHYYATLAGPRHLQPVLQRALRDRDAQLALDAIAALDSTATADSLLNLDGRIQPLLAALNYPDRRVRFDAAIAIATARPSESFEGGQRVIPVLAEAVREAGELYAVVLGPDNEAINNASQVLADAGEFRTLRADSVDVVAAQVSEAPGVDLVVINSPFAQAESAVANVRHNYKMMGAPIVVLAHAGEDVSLRRSFEDEDHVIVVDGESEPEELASAIREAVGSIIGSTLSADEAEAYASHALALLHEVKIGSNPAFDADDARAALLAALDDSREIIALTAADSLARFDGERIQQAIATRAISDERGEDMQVRFLNALATSARMHGNHLSPVQLRELVAMVNEASPGNLADAAAEAHGALNLPTSNVIDSITR